MSGGEGPGVNAAQDAAFIDSTYLTYIIPLGTEFNLESALKDVEDSHKPLFEAIEKRQSLFFGKSDSRAYIQGRINCHAHRECR